MDGPSAARDKTVDLNRLRPYVRPVCAALRSAGQDDVRYEVQSLWTGCDSSGSHGLPRVRDRLIGSSSLVQSGQFVSWFGRAFLRPGRQDQRALRTGAVKDAKHRAAAPQASLMAPSTARWYSARGEAGGKHHVVPSCTRQSARFDWPEPRRRVSSICTALAW